MKKGFDFWTSNDISSFLKKYWVIYFTFFLLAIWLTVVTKNPFVFLVVGFLPCPIIWVYRIVHKPFYKFEESIEKVAPEFYEMLKQHSSKLLSIKIATSELKHKQKVMQAALLNWRDDNIDPHIKIFIKNIRRVNQSGMISLLIWFLTFIIFVFIVFFMSNMVKGVAL
jgi:sensor histidine kinase YesM